MPTNQELKTIASQVRRDIIRMVHQCQSGHPGGSLGCTDFMVALYFKILRHNLPFSMEGHDEDMFFLSNGHISRQYVDKVWIFVYSFCKCGTNGNRESLS